VHVELPRPRDQLATKELPAFARLRNHVYRLVRQQSGAEEVREEPQASPAPAS